MQTAHPRHWHCFYRTVSGVATASPGYREFSAWLGFIMVLERFVPKGSRLRILLAFAQNLDIDL